MALYFVLDSLLNVCSICKYQFSLRTSSPNQARTVQDTLLRSFHTFQVKRLPHYVKGRRVGRRVGVRVGRLVGGRVVGRGL